MHHLERHYIEKEIVIAIFRHIDDARKAFEALNKRTTDGINYGMPSYDSVEYVHKNLRSDEMYRQF